MFEHLYCQHADVADQLAAAAQEEIRQMARHARAACAFRVAVIRKNTARDIRLFKLGILRRKEQ